MKSSSLPPFPPLVSPLPPFPPFAPVASSTTLFLPPLPNRRSPIEEQVKHTKSISQTLKNLADHLDTRNLNADYREKNLLDIAYLTILNGNKKSYFNENGNMDPVAFMWECKKLMNAVRSYNGEVFLNTFTIDDFRKIAATAVKKNGYLYFDGIQIKNEEIVKFKQFRDIRHSTKAGPNGIFDNRYSPGICNGLSIVYGNCVQTNTESKFMAEMIAAKRAPTKQEAFGTVFFEKIIHNQRYHKALSSDQKSLYENELGYATHIIFNFNSNDLLTRLSKFIIEIGTDKAKSCTCILHIDDEHAMNVTIKKTSSGLIKFKFYEPNTTKGPIVRYFNIDFESLELDMNPQLLLLKGEIEKIFRSSVYFGRAKTLSDTQFSKLQVFPLDQIKEFAPLHEISYPDIITLTIPQIENFLSYAVSHGHTDIVRELLKKDGIDINKVDVYGTSALMIAASQGHTDIVIELLKKDGIDINKVDVHGRSALMHAASQGHTDIVALLDPPPLSNRQAALDEQIKQTGSVSGALKLLADNLNTGILDQIYGPSFQKYRETNLIDIIYLTLLNGNRDLYFDESGSLKPDVLQEKTKEFMKSINSDNGTLFLNSLILFDFTKLKARRVLFKENGYVQIDGVKIDDEIMTPHPNPLPPFPPFVVPPFPPLQL